MSARGFELGFGQALLGLELGDAGGLFDDGAAVGGLGAEHLADAALLDDGVGVRAQADAHEEVLNVAQARGAAVDEVFALAGAIQAAADDHFAGMGVRLLLGGALLAEWVRTFGLPASLRHRNPRLGSCGASSVRLRETIPRRARQSDAADDGSGIAQNFAGRLGQLGIDQRQGDFGQAHGRALGGAVENAVGHTLGAERLVALLAQDPGDGVNDVGFAAAIWSDDAGEAGAAEREMTSSHRKI